MVVNADLAIILSWHCSSMNSSPDWQEMCQIFALIRRIQTITRFMDEVAKIEVRWWLPDSRHDLRWTFQIFVTLRPCQDSQTCHKCSVRVDINSYFLQQNVLQFTKTLIYLPVAPAIDPQVNEHWILLPGFVENRRHQPKGVNSCCLCNLMLPVQFDVAK